MSPTPFRENYDVWFYLKWTYLNSIDRHCSSCQRSVFCCCLIPSHILERYQNLSSPLNWSNSDHYLPSTERFARACAASLCTSGSVDFVRGTRSRSPPFSTIWDENFQYVRGILICYCLFWLNIKVFNKGLVVYKIKHHMNVTCFCLSGLTASFANFSATYMERSL